MLSTSENLVPCTWLSSQRQRQWESRQHCYQYGFSQKWNSQVVIYKDLHPCSLYFQLRKLCKVHALSCIKKNYCNYFSDFECTIILVVRACQHSLTLASSSSSISGCLCLECLCSSSWKIVLGFSSSDSLSEGGSLIQVSRSKLGRMATDGFTYLQLNSVSPCMYIYVGFLAILI